jgi:predicted MFS family arabinose efflux permease
MIGVGAAGFCAFLNLYATQPLLPLLLTAFHTDKAHVAWTVSAPALAVAFAAPLTGVLSDRLGRKRVIVPSMFLLLVPTIFAAFSNSLNELIFWRFVQGLILPAIFAVAMTYVSEEWSEIGLGQAMTVYVAGNVMGGFAGRLVSGLVAAQFGWRDSFLALAILNFIGALLAAFYLPRATYFSAGRASLGMVATMRSHLSNPPLLASFLIGGNLLFSLVAAFTYVTFYLSNPPFNLGATALSWLFSVYLVGAIVLPHIGKWIDHFGNRKALVAALVFSACGLGLTLIPHLSAVLLGLTMTSTAMFICQSSASSMLRLFAKFGNSTASGLYVCFYYIGGCLGGVLPSLVWSFGGWTACVGMLFLSHLLAILVALRYWHD